MLKTNTLIMNIWFAWLALILSCISESHFLFNTEKAILRWGIIFCGFHIWAVPMHKTGAYYWPWLAKSWSLMKFSALFPARTIVPSGQSAKMWSRKENAGKEIPMKGISAGEEETRGKSSWVVDKSSNGFGWKEDNADAEQMMRLSRGSLPTGGRKLPH